MVFLFSFPFPFSFFGFWFGLWLGLGFWLGLWLWLRFSLPLPLVLILAPFQIVLLWLCFRFSLDLHPLPLPLLLRLPRLLPYLWLWPYPIISNWPYRHLTDRLSPCGIGILIVKGIPVAISGSHIPAVSRPHNNSATKLTIWALKNTQWIFLEWRKHKIWSNFEVNTGQNSTIPLKIANKYHFMGKTMCLYQNYHNNYKNIGLNIKSIYHFIGHMKQFAYVRVSAFCFIYIYS